LPQEKISKRNGQATTLISFKRATTLKLNVMQNNNQSQKAGSNSSQYSAQGDIHISSGLDSTQMGELLAAVNSSVTLQLTLFTDIAKNLCQERLSDFEERVKKNFIEHGKGDISSFSDPDFQITLGSAAKNFARSGDGAVATSLIDLLSNRSLLNSRNRQQLATNRAIEIVPELTSSEISLITIIFCFKRSISYLAGTQERLANWCSPIINEFLPLISSDFSSLDYLVSCGCGVKNSYSQDSFAAVIKHNYGGLFTTGFAKDDLVAKIPENEQKFISPNLILPSQVNKQNFQIGAVNAKAVKSNLENAGFSSPSYS
jgi:hypothetical protein